MKKTITIAVLVFLSLLLLISLGYFLTDRVQKQEKAVINTPEEAAKVGQAYLEKEYPKLLEREYSYLAIYYPGEGWVVGALDAKTSKSRNLPMVCFKKTGEIVGFSLAND